MPEIRDRLIERLKEALLDRDGELANYQKHLEDVEDQVEELCRVRRREDVNLDYLKGVVVQYLSLPSGSSERRSLLAVLATLLQFNDSDYRTIEDGKSKISWWGGVTPTDITSVAGIFGGATDTAPANSQGSAEITITRDANPTTRENGKRTSLQF